MHILMMGQRNKKSKFFEKIEFWLWAGLALGKLISMVYFLLCWIVHMINYLKPSWHVMTSSCCWVWIIHIEPVNLMNWNFSLMTDTRWVIWHDMVDKYINYSFYNNEIHSVGSFFLVRRFNFVVLWQCNFTTDFGSSPPSHVEGLIIKL